MVLPSLLLLCCSSVVFLLFLPCFFVFTPLRPAPAGVGFCSRVSRFEGPPAPAGGLHYLPFSLHALLGLPSGVFALCYGVGREPRRRLVPSTRVGGPGAACTPGARWYRGRFCSFPPFGSTTSWRPAGASCCRLSPWGSAALPRRLLGHVPPPRVVPRLPRRRPGRWGYPYPGGSFDLVSRPTASPPVSARFPRRPAVVDPSGVHISLRTLALVLSVRVGAWRAPLPSGRCAHPVSWAAPTIVRLELFRPVGPSTTRSRLSTVSSFSFHLLSLFFLL